MYVMLGYWMTNKDHVIDAKSLDWSDQMNNNFSTDYFSKAIILLCFQINLSLVTKDIV